MWVCEIPIWWFRNISFFFLAFLLDLCPFVILESDFLWFIKVLKKYESAD